MTDGSLLLSGPRNRPIAEGSALATAGIGAVGLAGWLTGVAGLARWTDASVPISPVSAGALVLLGTAVFLNARWPAERTARLTAATAAVVVASVSLLLIARFVAGLDFGLDRALVPSMGAPLSSAGSRVSPLTALALFLGAASLVDRLAFPQRTNASGRAAGALGVGTVGIGAAVLAGYGAGTPLLYGGAVYPVALPTASGLALLGTALVAAALAPPAGLQTDPPAGATIRRSPRMRYVPIALAAGAGLMLSGVLATIVSRLGEARRSADFTRHAENTVAALSFVADGTFEAVATAHDLLIARRAVRRDEFRVFASAELLHGSEVQVLGWVPRVSDRQRAAYEAVARSDGVRGFRFTELDAGGMLVPAARRAEYFPAYYLQPRQGEHAALGFDLASEPTPRAALERARDTGVPTASAPFTLVLPGRPLGFLIAYPVYRPGAPAGDVAARRAALAGFAIGAVEIRDVVGTARRTVHSSEVFLRLVDATERAHPVLLFADPEALAPGGATIGTTTEFGVGGRIWAARIGPTAAYLESLRSWDAWLVLACGLLLTILIVAHLYSLERHSADVEAAHEKVAESEGRFRAIAESAMDAIITIDANGTITHCNGAALREFGYEDGSLLGLNVRVLIPPGLVAAHTAGLATYHATGQALIVGETHELPALHRDGSEFPIELSLATWETREGRFATAIVRNITDRKSAREERERLITGLQDALANVKTLRGLLPVCAWCRKVLDDRGAWRQMEAYVSEHTEAEFSHGMCPACEKKFEAGEV